MVNVVHLTSAHPRYDTRIFQKMCKSLSKMYNVSLIVADGKNNDIKENIQIYDVGKPINRINRIFKITKKIYKKAIELDADIYHLHDPELIPIGIKLKKNGKKIIFDMHENIPLQIKDKNYINIYIRRLIAYIYKFYEKYALNKFNAIVLAEDSYKFFYPILKDKYVTILNMPDVEKLIQFRIIDRQYNKNELFYIGGISNERGLDITIKALKEVKKNIPDIYIHYVGNTYDSILQQLDLKDIKNNVKFYGYMPLNEAMKISQKAKIGLSILKPIPNYMNSYSTKIFEYMAIGLPVITSNFKLYKDIIEKYNCGICVNPLDYLEVANAIEYIIKNPLRAKEMGQNGIKIIEQKYNWKNEEEKLFKLYKKVLNDE